MGIRRAGSATRARHGTHSVHRMLQQLLVYEQSKERCLIHVFSQKHHNHCKKKLQASITTSSQNLMKESSANVVRGEEIISLIKNYASQHCIAKSLSFTTASMALDCVCVDLSTIATGGISPESIAVLEKSGRKHEVFYICLCLYPLL